MEVTERQISGLIALWIGGTVVCMGGLGFVGLSLTRGYQAQVSEAQAPMTKSAREGLALDRFDDGDMEEDEKRPRARRRASAAADKPLQIIKGRGKEEMNLGKMVADEAPPEEPAAAEPAESGQVRQWFPESFLWRPLVTTNAQGIATVPVKVPDQLTEWRVLALAHTVDGGQAGTVHSFDSTLPTYVDPVIPGWLYDGDQVLLPIQVVNNTDAEVEGRLRVQAGGALEGSGASPLVLGPYDSVVPTVALTAVSSGPATVTARLVGSDAAKRRLPVQPTGRPVERTRGGTLAGSRDFTIRSPRRANPNTQQLSVLVYPGPLAVLQAEVERLQGGSVPWDGAYGFALSSRLTQLSAQTGVDSDPKAMRKLQTLSWQRIVRLSRSPDAGQAADLLAALENVEGHELAENLRTRLVRVVAQGQRADGSWARQPTASLQTVVVQTAFAARSLPESEAGARLRASGAIERYAREIKDPYTASVVLASGLADGGLRDQLLRDVKQAASIGSNGHMQLSGVGAVHNPWGYRPTRAEVNAWACLALAEHDPALAGDFVSELMSGYDARRGFGAGTADAIALEAISKALPALPQPVDVVLSVDGAEVARASVDPSQPRVPALLEARPKGADGAYTLTVEPATPGLAWMATLASWVPWDKDAAMPGVEVTVAPKKPLVAGQQGTLMITLSAPSKARVTVSQGLPAGTTVDEDRLKRLGFLASAVVHTDRVELQTRPFGAGEVMEIPVEVTPAFAGRFSTLPLELSVDGRDEQLPPHIWDVTR